MKWLLFFHLLAALIMGSCNLLSSEPEVKSFIPGTYVSEWTSEFARSRDTLQIELATPSGSEQYVIIRRTYHEYNQETKPLAPQYKIEHWTGSFAESEKVILVHKNGRVLSFDPKNKELKMGVTKYRKL